MDASNFKVTFEPNAVWGWRWTVGTHHETIGAGWSVSLNNAKVRAARTIQAQLPQKSEEAITYMGDELIKEVTAPYRHG